MRRRAAPAIAGGILGGPGDSSPKTRSPAIIEAAAGACRGRRGGTSGTADSEAERCDGGRRPDAESGGSGRGRRFHVVVLGTGPVGKTSLINALLGRSAGETGATIGTTAHGRTHTHAVEGVEGTLLLTDTPGLGEAGRRGRRPRGRGRRPGDPGRPAGLRRGPGPGAGRSPDDRRDGAGGEAADRRAQQEGPADGRGPRGDPRQAAGAAGRAGPAPRTSWRSRPTRRRSRSASASPTGRPRPPWRRSRPTWRPWRRGWRRSSHARGTPSAPATSCSAPAGSSGPSGPASPRSVASGPWRSSSGTSGWPP